MRTLLAALVLLVATPALADAPTIAGTFGFDSMNPTKSKCKKLSGALLKKVSGYKCEAMEPGTTASGRDAVAQCTSKSGKSSFMLFAANADCKEERETQLANGAGD